MPDDTTNLRLELPWDEGGNLHLTHVEIQAIVNAAALQYGIRPECLCYPAGLSGPQGEDDCPRHKGESA